jgi:hypothetical protein
VNAGGGVDEIATHVLEALRARARPRP